MAEIIRIASGGESKTQIMYKANISFNQLNKYLRILTRTKLLEKTLEYGTEIYNVTQKGKIFFTRHAQIMELLSEDSNDGGASPQRRRISEKSMHSESKGRRMEIEERRASLVHHKSHAP